MRRSRTTHCTLWRNAVDYESTQVLSARNASRYSTLLKQSVGVVATMTDDWESRTFWKNWIVLHFNRAGVSTSGRRELVRNKGATARYVHSLYYLLKLSSAQLIHLHWSGCASQTGYATEQDQAPTIIRSCSERRDWRRYDQWQEAQIWCHRPRQFPARTELAWT